MTPQQKREYMRHYYRKWRNTTAGREWAIKKADYAKKWRAENKGIPKGARKTARKNTIYEFAGDCGPLASWGYGGYRHNGVSRQFHL